MLQLQHYAQKCAGIMYPFAEKRHFKPGGGIPYNSLYDLCEEAQLYIEMGSNSQDFDSLNWVNERIGKCVISVFK